MKKIVLLFILFVNTSVFSQITKEVDNGLYVAFPSRPEYKLEDKFKIFSLANKNSVYMTIVSEVMPNYTQYLRDEQKMSSDDKMKFKNVILDNFIEGFVGYMPTPANIEDVIKGSYYGKKFFYSALHPGLGERTERMIEVYFVKGKVVCFFVFHNQINPSINAKNEVNEFFNSITINQNL